MEIEEEKIRSIIRELLEQERQHEALGSEVRELKTKVKNSKVFNKLQKAYILAAFDICGKPCNYTDWRARIFFHEKELD